MKLLVEADIEIEGRRGPYGQRWTAHMEGLDATTISSAPIPALLGSLQSLILKTHNAGWDAWNDYWAWNRESRRHDGV